MSKIKLEVGKTYRNRKGEEVKIVRKANVVENPYRGSNNEWYYESGKWSYFSEEDPKDLIEEVTATRYTFAIPEGAKKVTVSQEGNRIVVEMVPEKGPKPGDVMINNHGSVYIFKEDLKYNFHKHYAWLGKDGRLEIGTSCIPGRPATPEEAQPLFDALKKAGKRWNAETMKVEYVPESTRICEWVEEHLNDGYYNQKGIAEAIEDYLKHKEGEK